MMLWIDQGRAGGGERVVAGDKPAIADIRDSERQICRAIERTVLLVIQRLAGNRKLSLAL